MIAGATGPRWRRADKPKGRKIEFLDKQIDNADKVILTDPVLNSLWKKCCLIALNTLDKTCHTRLPQPRGSLPRDRVSTHPRPKDEAARAAMAPVVKVAR